MEHRPSWRKPAGMLLILAIIGTLLPEAETAAGLARAAVRPA